MWLLCYTVPTLMGKIKTGRKIRGVNNNNNKKREEEGVATAECEGGECQSGRVAMVVPEEGVLAALRAPEPSTPCAPKT